MRARRLAILALTCAAAVGCTALAGIDGHYMRGDGASDSADEHALDSADEHDSANELIPDAGAANLLRNPSFEEQGGGPCGVGWDSSHSPQRSAEGRDGGSACRICGGPQYDVAQKFVNIPKGKYDLEASFRSAPNAALPSHCYVTVTPVPGPGPIAYVADASPPDMWQTAGGQIFIGAEQLYVVTAGCHSQSTTATTCALVDDVRLVRAP